MQIKRHIPNALTVSNLLFGFTGIILALKMDVNRLELIPLWLMLGSLIADFLDGLVARLLKAASPIGKQLDSLADVISFGVFPGILMFVAFGSLQDPGELGIWMFSILFIPACAALRLAKFNIAEDQSNVFIGLPSPAAGIWFLSVFFLVLKGWWPEGTAGLIALAGFCVLGSLLMVSNIRLIALKFEPGGLKKNLFRFILIAVSLILILTGLVIGKFFLMIFISIIAYIVISLIQNAAK